MGNNTLNSFKILLIEEIQYRFQSHYVISGRMNIEDLIHAILIEGLQPDEATANLKGGRKLDLITSIGVVSGIIGILSGIYTVYKESKEFRDNAKNNQEKAIDEYLQTMEIQSLSNDEKEKLRKSALNLLIKLQKG